MIPKQQSRLDGFRHHRDHYFGHDPDSPLAVADRDGFAGLGYFPERPDLALELPLEPDGAGIGEEIDLPTSDGGQLARTAIDLLGKVGVEPRKGSRVRLCGISDRLIHFILLRAPRHPIGGYRLG